MPCLGSLLYHQAPCRGHIQRCSPVFSFILEMPCLLLVGSHPDLPQMLSCTWTTGVPALTLIPHTESTSFAAAAQAFADLHYATSTAQLATPTIEYYFGHKF